MMLNLVPLPYRILAGVLLIISVFGFGYVKGYGNASNKYEAENAKYVAEAERRYNELLIKKNKVDVQIVTEYVEKIVEVTKWRTKNVEVVKYVPDSGVLSDGWVSVHDASARALHADSARAADETPSGITAAEALSGVVENYAICKQNSEQLVALQKWITEQSKATNPD